FRFADHPFGKERADLRLTHVDTDGPGENLRDIDHRDARKGAELPDHPPCPPISCVSPARRTASLISSAASGLMSEEVSPGLSPRQAARTIRRMTFMLRVFGRSETGRIKVGR